MLKQVLFFFSLFSLLVLKISALEITLEGAKQNHQKFSILHLKDRDKFLCQSQKNEFDVTTKIICAFSQKPSQKIKEIKNNFFDIDTQVNNKTFFIIIKPFQKMKLIPIVFDLKRDDTTYTSNIKLAKHWMITGYIKELPFEKKESYSPQAINFPITINEDLLPYVGGLDIDGKPVKVKQVQDVTDYLEIKKLYKDKKYELCYDLLEETLAQYPNTLFKPELYYYKIKLQTQNKDYEGVVDLGKTYLQDYSSNNNMAEVLSLIAKAYTKLGQSSDADYFFERLFSEYKESKFAQWGYIYKAEMLEANGDNNRALGYYEKALKLTNDLDVAATAAFQIARYQINYGNHIKAAAYITKILKAKPSFFKSQYDISRETMKQFAQEGDYLTAASIAKVLLVGLDQYQDDDAEILLKDEGIWLSKTDKKLEALNVLNKYLKNYEGGTYEPEVEVAKDSLFFDVDTDDNVSAKLAKLDSLEQTYQGDTIGDRAVYEKAKLLLQNAKYKDLLKFKNKILALDKKKYTDTSALIHDAAVGLMEQSLKDNECNQVLATSNEYNITLSDRWDDGVYACSMKGADYALARATAQKNLKSLNLGHRKKWLYRYIKIDFATGNYSDVIEASNELKELIQDDKNSKYLDIYRIIFDTYQRVEQDNNMLKAMVNLQKIFGLDYKDIQRYIAVMNVGIKMNDDNIVIKYATDVIKLQRKYKTNTQSPFVEFSVFEAYMEKEDYNKALDIMQSLNMVKLSTKDKARQQYLLGSVYTKLWRDKDAIKAFQEVMKLAPSSSWATLAKDAKSIVEQ